MDRLERRVATCRHMRGFMSKVRESNRWDCMSVQDQIRRSEQFTGCEQSGGDRQAPNRHYSKNRTHNFVATVSGPFTKCYDA